VYLLNLKNPKKFQVAFHQIDVSPIALNGGVFVPAPRDLHNQWWFFDSFI
jgi:hypothetical protein